MIEQKTILYPNLLAEIARCGKTYSEIAGLLELSPSSFGRRLSGQVEWSKSEIDTLCDYFKKTYDYLFGQ